MSQSRLIHGRSSAEASRASFARRDVWWIVSTGVLSTSMMVAAAVLLFSDSDSESLTNSKAASHRPVPARLAARGTEAPTLTECRTQPVHVGPVSGLEHLVSADDLVSVLCSALPLWHPPPVPCVLHQLKLWGTEAAFTEEMVGVAQSGTLWVNILLSDEVCRTHTAPVGGSYLLDSPFGIRVVLQGTEDAVEYRAEAHYGQLLMALGQAGVPSTAAVTTSSGRIGTVRDLYQDALMRFSLSRELPFIACALAYWHPPRTTWHDKFGNQYTFDDLVSALIALPDGEGSCGGCHVPYALVVILRVDERHSILSESIRRDARRRLIHLAHLLEQQQLDRGGWDTGWPGVEGVHPITGDKVLDRIMVTGHQLEWIALATEEMRPSESTIRGAVLALRRDVESLAAVGQHSFRSLLPMSHAARALALMRSDNPYAVWLQHWKSGRIQRTTQGLELREPSR